MMATNNKCSHELAIGFVVHYNYYSSVSQIVWASLFIGLYMQAAATNTTETQHTTDDAACCLFVGNLILISHA